MAKGKYEDWLTPEGLAKIEGWARNGLTDKQIALNIGISEKAFCNWKNKYSSITSALKKGKEPANLEVENALFKLATGYSVKLRKPIKVRRRGGNEEIQYAYEEIYIKPEVAAQVFWLKNRMKDKWRDKPEAEVDVNPVTIVWKRT